MPHIRTETTPPRQIMAPMIHNNGTSPERLCDDAMDVIHKLHAVRDHLAAARPNVRDYYPESNAAWREAQAEHNARMESIDQLIADYEALGMYAADQRDARAEQMTNGGAKE